MQAGLVTHKVLWAESRTYGSKVSRFTVTLIRSMLVSENKWTHSLLCETDLVPKSEVIASQGIGVMSAGANIAALYSAEVMMAETDESDPDVILTRKAMAAADKHFQSMDGREIS